MSLGGMALGRRCPLSGLLSPCVRIPLPIVIAKTIPGLPQCVGEIPTGDVPAYS